MTVIPKCSGRFIVFGIALASAALFSHSAAASVQFDISVLGGTNGPYNNSFGQPGAPTAFPQVLNYQGSLVDPFGEWTISTWDFNADGNPNGTGPETGVRIGSVFTVQNNRPDSPNPAANHLYFSIMITRNISPLQTATAVYGNGGMTLTIDQSANGNPGVLSAIGTAIWNYRINGADVATLFNPGYQLGGSNGPATISASNTALNAGQTTPLIGMVVSSIGIRLDFDLSPGERVTFNGAFGVIPAPGCLALLGLAGIAGRTRRRRI